LKVEIFFLFFFPLAFAPSWEGGRLGGVGGRQMAPDYFEVGQLASLISIFFLVTWIYFEYSDSSSWRPCYLSLAGRFCLM
jgi:hypothetical protein